HADYRSNERTFQLVTQVAGRAGRNLKAGNVILQTFSPNHYVYAYAKNYDYEGFFEKENNLRQTNCFPPYSTILRVMMTSEIEEKVVACAKTIYGEVKTYYEAHKQDFYVMQAMKSPITKIQNKYRYQILMRFKLENQREIMSKVFDIIDKTKAVGVSVFAEINPQNLS
ncbi:MAG: primosomal protein N', partial [Clostridia bacterium]